MLILAVSEEKNVIHHFFLSEMLRLIFFKEKNVMHHFSPSEMLILTFSEKKNDKINVFQKEKC